MLLARRACSEIVSCHIRQSFALHLLAPAMGEGCCGVSGSSAPTEQLNGMHLDHHHAGSLSSNGKAAPVKNHKQAAEELQGWIGKRIELFDQFSERQKQQVAHCRALRFACDNYSI